MEFRWNGEVLRRFREALGLSSDELGQILGYSGSAIRHWESGRRKPAISDVQKLAATFGISLDDFLAGKPVRPTRFPPSALGLYVKLRTEDGLSDADARLLAEMYERVRPRRGERPEAMAALAFV